MAAIPEVFGDQEMAPDVAEPIARVQAGRFLGNVWENQKRANQNWLTR